MARNGVWHAIECGLAKLPPPSFDAPSMHLRPNYDNKLEPNWNRIGTGLEPGENRTGFAGRDYGVTGVSVYSVKVMK